MSFRMKNNFTNLVKEPNFCNRRNSLFNLPDAMRTFKTHDVIDYMMPWIFKNTNKRWNILTAPLDGILKEKQVLGAKMAANNGATFCDDFNTIKSYLRNGMKVVSFFTNSKAYTRDTMIDFIKTIDPSIISIFADEIDTWGVSHASLMRDVKGYTAQEDRYKASFYRTMSDISKHTAYCFSLTATESFEFQGKVQTYGDLNYYSVNPLEPGDQKVHAPYVAHYGGTHFFSDTDNLYDEDQTNEAIGLMIKNNLIIETKTNLKRAMLIGCGMDKSGEYDDDKTRAQHGRALNPDKVVKVISTYSDYLKPDFQGCVMTGSYSYVFDRNGNILYENISESDVHSKINDLSDPMKMLLVKNMAGRGVTFYPVKDVMLLKVGDASTPYGQSTETPHQFFGRGKSVYVGTSQKDFFTKYKKDVRNVPGYNQLANTYLLYAPDITRLRETEKIHREIDACTPDMLGKNYTEICEHCGSIISKKMNGSLELSEHDEKLIKNILDNELGIND